MKLKLGKKNYISLIVFICLYIAVIFLIVFPLINWIQKSSQQLLLEKEARLSFAEEKKNLQDFKVIYQEIRSDLERAEGLFISSDIPIIESINFLEETASSSNIFLKISSVTSYDDGESWPFLNFYLQVTASFNNLSRFIEKLENSPYLVEVHDLSIRKLAGGNLYSGEVVEVSANLSLKIFTK